MSGRLYARHKDRKWTVVRHGGVWEAWSPRTGLIGASFPTHAEAIAYATAQARKAT